MNKSTTSESPWEQFDKLSDEAQDYCWHRIGCFIIQNEALDEAALAALYLTVIHQAKVYFL